MPSSPPRQRAIACALCRRLKVKCHMNGGTPPCQRCRRRNLSCTLNKSLQAMLDGDSSYTIPRGWKESIEERLQRLEEAQNPRDNTLIAAVSHVPDFVPTSITATDAELSGHPSELDLSCSLGAFPASSVKAPSNQTRKEPSTRSFDPVSARAVTIECAEVHFNFYKRRLDRYMHYLLSEEDTLEAVRAQSPLLLCAICTAASSCTGSEDTQPCLSNFKEAISKLLFATSHCFDDVRALCIGAMWLGEISLACHSLAVRIGAALNLHRCITKMPHTKYECYERTRLYYVLHLVDHHSSLAYGRPPMTNEWASLRSPKTFLQSLHCRAIDFSLIGQIEFWAISRHVFESFGADIERKPGSGIADSILTLNDIYDQWHKEWVDIIVMKTQSDNDERRTFDLYFQCAKLYLFSHIFRGRSKDQLLTPQCDRLEQQALDAALGVLQCVCNQQQAEDWLQTLPSYFEAMISFACLFIAKTVRHEGPKVDEDHINKCQNLLREVSNSLRHSHTAKTISKQLHELVGRTESAHRKYMHTTSAYPEPGDEDMQHIPMDFDFEQLIDSNFDWHLPGFDDFWTCSHDVQLDIF